MKLKEGVYSGKELEQLQTESEPESGDSFAAVLRELRWLLSGMIYGYNILWVPSDSRRGVQEKLEVTPIASLPLADMRKISMRVIREDQLYYVNVEYSPNDIQSRYLAVRQSRPYHPASGQSELILYEYRSRQQTVEDAIKQAVRNWLRIREYNKPYRIQARAALLKFPVFSFTGLRMQATVHIALIVDRSVPY